jgi:hypothetical protein
MLHVGEDLHPMAASRTPGRACFHNALVQTAFAGCTTVINRPARALCLEGLPYYPPMHDSWLYLVVSAFGTVIYDDAITILHRLHAQNVSPALIWRHWPRRIAAHLTRPRNLRRSVMVAKFYETLGGQLDAEKRTAVEQLLAYHTASWLSRARYVARSPIFRQPALDNAIFRVLFTLGRF